MRHSNSPWRPPTMIRPIRLASVTRCLSRCCALWQRHARRALSRRSAWPQMRPMPRQPDRRRFAHNVRRHVRTDDIARAAYRHRARQLDRPARSIPARGRRFSIRRVRDAGARMRVRYSNSRCNRRGCTWKRMSFPTGCSPTSMSRSRPAAPSTGRHISFTGPPPTTGMSRLVRCICLLDSGFRIRAPSSSAPRASI